MPGKLGSQNEANEIFEYAQRWIAWRNQEDNNYYARNAFMWHGEALDEYNADQKAIAAGAEIFWPRRHPGTLEIHHPYGPNLPEPELMPGWKFLAAGASRRAYLAPSGVVYKVMKSPGSAYQDNRAEHEMAKRCRSLGPVKGAYIPRTSIWEVPGCHVIAIEFIDGLRNDPHWDQCYYGKCKCAFPGSVRCTMNIRRELERKYGLCDLHSHNVLWMPRQRAWAVVDLGNG